MRIGLVVPGGVDRSGTHRVIPCLLWLIERLAREHDLQVFSLGHYQETCRYELLGATVHNVARSGRRLRGTTAILAEHRRQHFDVLHAVWAVPAGTVASVAGRLIGRPVVLHLTGGDLAALPDIGYGVCRSRRGRAWLRQAAAGARRLTVPSDAMATAARALGMRPQRLPFGVALDRWPVRAPRRRAPDSPARLLFVGSLNRVKDPFSLLRAAARLRAAGVAFRLDVVGEDTLDGEVHRLATELGLDAQVRFRGFLPHAALRPCMEAADLLLVSSRHEADPIVALEAAVIGVPVVGTAVGHLVDWAPEAALVVPVGDPEALAAAVLRVLASEDDRLGLAAAAQRRALAEDADWSASRVQALYRELAMGSCMARAGAS